MAAEHRRDLLPAHRDMHAIGRQPLCEGSADAAAGSGDEG